jgi:ABC-2 type transport system permease protein
MSTTLTHTWYLTGRRLHAFVRQPFVVFGSVVQPAIWLFLFGQLFSRVVDIPGFGGGSYIDYLIPGIIAMNAMNGNMFAGMDAIEEIERGTLNRFLVSPASRLALMNANVVELAVKTALQTILIVLLGLLGGAELRGGPAGFCVILAASILLGTVFGTLSNTAGMLIRQREAIIGIYIAFMLPLTFLSTAFMPRDLMPRWIRVTAAGNPLDWAVTAGRSALGTDPDWAGIAARCGGLLALAVLCVTLSVATFRSYQKNV